MARLTVIPLVLGIAAIAAASLLGNVGRAERATWPAIADPPFAPEASTIAFASVGYRELAADLLWLRLVGYSSGDDDFADGDVALLDAIVGADPYFSPTYDSGADRILLANHGVDLSARLAAIRILSEGARRYPNRWRYPFGIGQMYILELRPMAEDDPDLQRDYTEQGIAWLERAVRLPDAPASAGTLAASMMTKLGRAQQAEDSLRELIITTDDENQRTRLIARLAEVTETNATELKETLLAERDRFIAQWQRERPAIPPSLYILVGPPPSPRFDLDNLVNDQLLGANPDDESPPPLPPLADDVGELPLPTVTPTPDQPLIPTVP